MDLHSFLGTGRTCSNEMWKAARHKANGESNNEESRGNPQNHDVRMAAAQTGMRIIHPEARRSNGSRQTQGNNTDGTPASSGSILSHSRQWNMEP